MKPLLEPTKLYSRSEVLSDPLLVPEERGLYAWYFKKIPGITPTDGCVVKDGRTLLYVGMSRNLRRRVVDHFTKNAEASTFRLTLGVLLTEESGFPLRIENGKRMTFAPPGENWLDGWMQQNAFVCWTTHLKPLEAKLCIIKNVSLPPNIHNNEHHPFSKILKKTRREAKRLAKGTADIQ